MRRKLFCVLAILFASMLAFGIAGSLKADSPYHLPFDISMEPRMPLGESKHVTLDIRVRAESTKWINSKCTISPVIFLHGDMKDTLEKQILTAQYDSTCTASASFEITLPDHEITHLDVIVRSNGLSRELHRFFSTMEDETKFMISAPMHLSPTVENRERERKAKFYTYRGLKPDTLTEELLQRKYTVILGLKDAEEKMEVEKIVGPIADTCTILEKPGCYRITTSLENLIEMDKMGIWNEMISSWPWKQNANSTTTGEDNQSPPPNLTCAIPNLSTPSPLIL